MFNIMFIDPINIIMRINIKIIINIVKKIKIRITFIIKIFNRIILIIIIIMLFRDKIKTKNPKVNIKNKTIINHININHIKIITFPICISINLTVITNNITKDLKTNNFIIIKLKCQKMSKDNKNIKNVKSSKLKIVIVKTIN